MTDQDKAKAREREAKVAQLARELFVAGWGSKSDDYLDPESCFSQAAYFLSLAESRWETLK